MKVSPVITGKKALLIAALALIVIFTLSGTAQAATYGWRVNYQHVTLDIDRSGQVYMTYQVDANINSNSDPWNEVWVPATVSNMQVTSVVDSNGVSHNYYMDSGQIKTQGWDLRAGDHVNLIINSTLPGFVYKAKEQGYDIVEFIPPWWDMPISDTRVEYILPAEIPTSEVFTGNRQYNGIGNYSDLGRTFVFFTSSYLGNNQQFDTAVSFPDRYMTPGAVTSSGTSGGIAMPVDVGGILSSIFDSACCLVPFIMIVIVIFIGIVGGNRRSGYSSPTLSMSGMGVNQNLDPVEAAMLLRDDPRRILTMIMFGLMKKGNVKLISTEPLKLERVSRKDVNYYEAAFLDSIVGDSLSEDHLLLCFRDLAKRVVDKTRPYSRKETEAFYRKKIDDAWKDVQAVDTPELKLQKYDTNMFWLMADDQFANKTVDSLRSPGWNTYTIPPYYWWFPYYFGLPHGAPAPTAPSPTGQQPTPTMPGGSHPTNQTTSTVESFAKNFTSSVEKTATGMVAGVESFVGVRNAANAPPAPAASRASSGGSSCACVSCACACAHCACACACAGGGGGCT